MSIIAISGTTGVGKSYVTKQLAALNCMPAFFEGEEGVIPSETLKLIWENDPTQRFKYFLDQYSSVLSRARQVSDIGLDVYIDFSKQLFDSYIQYEPLEFHETLIELVNSYNFCEVDLEICLITTEDKLKDQIRARKRSNEQRLSRVLSRASLLQEIIIKNSRDNSDIVLIDRTNFDFSNRTDLMWLNSQINKN